MSKEKKYSREEINAIVNDALRKAGLATGRELNMDEMENVSGGVMIVPSTHEEIDQKMDVIQSVIDTYGIDVGLIAAQELCCAPGKTGTGRSNPFADGKVDHVRNWMHRELDGTNDGIGGHWITIY